jgi:hypothetical protein
MHVGIVIGVRNRASIYKCVSAFKEAGFIVCVVEQNNIQRYKEAKEDYYVFHQTSDVYSRSLANNLGAEVLKEMNYIWFADADILISPEVGEGIKPYLDERILFPRIGSYTTGAHTGNMVVPKALFSHLSFNEELVGWGYEDDDYLHRCRQRGAILHYAVDIGLITHLKALTPEKQEHFFPGCKKWNCWGHNVIISDYALSIPENSPGFGPGDIRREFPKEWMDINDYN